VTPLSAAAIRLVNLIASYDDAPHSRRLELWERVLEAAEEVRALAKADQ
jgi:hypothetical protein